MSAFDVLRDRGTAALLKFFGALALFLLLHLIRIPVVLIARVLEGVMRRIDGYITQQASSHTKGPINQYFAEPNPRYDKEAHRVYA